jgi:type VI secretion system protein ImpG
MDKRFLSLYNNELQFIRELSGEFAAEYPKIAGRLGLDREGKEVCADPFVERLLEGFAFLTARVQNKFEAEFPRLTQSLLDTIYPHYLAPVPSMLVARLEPDLSDAALIAGYPVKRGTVIRSTLGRGERTACEYRSAHHVALWPLRVAEAQYYTRDVAALNLPPGTNARAALRIQLEITAGANGTALGKVPHLDFYIRGSDEFPMRLYEQVIGRHTGSLVRPVVPGQRNIRAVALPKSAVQRLGFAEDEALLPQSPRSFEGYRLLKEYFSFSARFLFFRVAGIGKALAENNGRLFDLILLFNEQEQKLEGKVDATSFDLFCTPAVNLVSRRADRIQLSDRFHEHQIVVDRTRPLDFEVFQIEKVTGIGSKAGEEQEFRPFYRSRHDDFASGAFFSTHRVTRTLTQQEKRFGKNSSYTGSELYVSLVDAAAAPYRTSLRQLAVEVLVTNRHLPLTMALGLENTDFFLEAGGPVKAVRCVTGPTPPRPPFIDGEILWRIVSHLSLNYFSLLDSSGGEGATAFRELLRLYVDTNDRSLLKQIDGVRSILARPVVRRVELPGPVTFARGSEIALTLDETAFEGTGIFLFGAVVERFFAKYVSVNSFTETVVVSSQRGEVMRWPIQIGNRPCA